MTALSLILASSSPRRRWLMSQAGLRFRVVVPEIDESPKKGEAPEDLARRLALEKARAVHERHPKTLCLAADTIVVLDGVIYNKPRDRAEARRMLRRLSGRTHTVYTAVALVGPEYSGSRLVASKVRFRRLGEREIRDYVRGGESLDKAGAYALQGHGGGLVAAVLGDRTNVIGLPMRAVRDLLRRAQRRGSGRNARGRP